MKRQADRTKVQRVLGWSAVAITSGIASFWSFWGIIENFHEGWYYPDTLQNIGLLAMQYLSPLALFVALSLTAIRWPLVGGPAFAAVGIGMRFLLLKGISPAGTTLILLPMLTLGALFTFGRPQPRRFAAYTIVLPPLLTLIVAGMAPAMRVAARDKTVLTRPFQIHGNGVDLEWAPAGPGWPDDGVSWFEARRICSHLSQDGTRLLPTEQDYWRLPSVDEAVRSMNLHGLNAEGTWNPTRLSATYRSTPDKEAPLWNPRSKVIYWWTGRESGPAQALIVVYDGSVWPRKKVLNLGYLGFRAVHPAGRSPDPTHNAKVGVQKELKHDHRRMEGEPGL